MIVNDIDIWLREVMCAVRINIDLLIIDDSIIIDDDYYYETERGNQ